MRTIGTPSTQARKLNAIASGALPNGKPVIVNADGTVSVVAGPPDPTQLIAGRAYGNGTAYDSNSEKTVMVYNDSTNSYKGTAVVATVSGNEISLGVPVIYDTSLSSADTIAVFDSNSNKIVVLYHDDGNSSYGTAIVGTVSGTSISFGTAVVFASETSQSLGAAFDSNSNKIVVAGRIGSSGKAVVGTVSGTGISFGSAVTYESGAALENNVVFDSSSNKIVIAFSDDNDGGDGKAIVGTVSGTSISFGAQAEFTTDYTTNISATFDSSSNKVLIAWSDINYVGKAVVGTVSGTSISYGTVASSFGDAQSLTSAYNAATNKHLLFFRDLSSPNYGMAVQATVSGTSVSFSSEAAFTDFSVFSPDSAAYDSTEQKVILCFRNFTDSVQVAAVYTDLVANLTSENYIGLSSNGYPDTAGATIDVQGAINDRQSGLTAGQSYYVQTDGTLDTTAGDPSVFAGTAISATKMIVKG